MNSGLGVSYSLGAETFGRFSKQVVELLPILARERARGCHSRLQRSIALGYLYRWSGLLSIALQKAVTAAAMRNEGADLPTTLLEPSPAIADLQLV